MTKVSRTPAQPSDNGLPPRDPGPGDPDFGCGPRYHEIDLEDRTREPLPSERIRAIYDRIPENSRLLVLKSRKVGVGAVIARSLRQLYLDSDGAAVDNGMGC